MEITRESRVMMKSRVFSKMLLLFIISFVFIGMCYADEEEESCLLEDRVRLREEASKVKVSYEPITLYCTLDNKNDFDDENDVEECDVSPAEDWTDDPNPSGNIIGYKKYALNLKVYNMPSDLFVRVIDNKVENSFYSYDVDEEGIISMIIDDISKIRNVKVVLMSVHAPCYLYKVRTMSITIPKYNYYSGFSACDGLEDYYVCQKYIAFEMDGEYFRKHIDDYREKLSEMKDSSIDLDNNDYGTLGISRFFEKNKIIILVVVIVIGILATLFVIIRAKKVRK